MSTQNQDVIIYIFDYVCADFYCILHNKFGNPAGKPAKNQLDGASMLFTVILITAFSV